MDSTTTSPCTHHHSDLIMWKSPVRTLVAIVIINTLFYLLTRGGFSVLTLLCYVGLTFLGSSAVYIYGSMFYAHYLAGTPAENPFKEVPEYKVEATEQHIEHTSNAINHALAVAIDMFSFVSPIRSIKFAVFLFVLAFFGAKLSLFTIVYLFLMGMFTIPYIYHSQQDLINSLIASAKMIISEQVNKIKKPHAN